MIQYPWHSMRICGIRSLRFTARTTYSQKRTSQRLSTMPIALITGASREDTIGFEVARQLGAKGYDLILPTRSIDAGRKVSEVLKTKHEVNNVHVVELDLTKPESVKACADEVKKQTGALDVLVNCAGISLASTYDKGIEALKGWKDYSLTEGLRAIDTTHDDLEAIFRTNVFGAIELTNALAPLLLQSKAPRLVFVSTTIGTFESADKPDAFNHYFFAYASSKAALNMAALSYSKQLPKLNPAIKVNLVCPGYPATALNGYQGFGTTPDSAIGIVELATVDEHGPNGEFLAAYAPYGEPGKMGRVPW
ncbi:hypothetical protein BD324DRAFT_611591 [Kockovaella imperatae]|uniref:NAD(P)-binding protein n=1 Tax=Kockovaella imperatae TaxID=4999 RepID=A0A1Y1UTW9_9TREE|nr:hypothetical protein BD324DRAFT_611591 [Kockovaella imperatae]ORX40635.1 hypothetical protein BD324DRAFT_611591 [Kockovaella imperatae]